MADTFRVGLDPGFGSVKAACIGPNALTIATLPSVVGIGETEMGLLSVGNLGRHRSQRQPDRVRFELDGAQTYLVGDNVARFARPVERMDFLRLSEGPELRALFYDAMFRLLGADEHCAALVVGLPVEVMADRERGLATLRGLRGWMLGHHAFRVNGTPVTLTVSEVQAMAQPAGTYFAWGLNDQGQWARPRNDLKAPVAICDIGFNTGDLYAVQGGEIMARFTAGDTVGMRRAAEAIVRAIRDQYGLSLSLHEADALLRERQPRLYTTQGEADALAITSQALHAVAAAVLTFIERQWGNAKQFAHLLFTGGGAEALREPLLRHYPHGLVLPNAVTANAIGLARYAARVYRPASTLSIS